MSFNKRLSKYFLFCHSPTYQYYDFCTILFCSQWQYMWAFIYLVHNKCPRIPHYGIHIMVQSQLKYIYHRVDMGHDAHKHLLHYYVNPLKEKEKMKLFIYVGIIDNKKSKWRNNNKKIVYGLTFGTLLPYCCRFALSCAFCLFYSRR